MRREGDLPTRPAADVMSLDAAIGPYAGAPILDWIDAANRLLSRAPSGASLDVRLVRAGPDGVEFLFARPVAEAPWPFRPEHGGRWWRLDTVLDLETLTEAAQDLPRRYPALVPVGDDEQSSYLIPLQPGRRLGITGTPELVDAALGAIVAALRVAPWAEQCMIELVGVAAPPASEQCFQLHSSRPAALRGLADDAASRVTASDPSVGSRQPILVLARGALADPDDAFLDKASKVTGVIAAGRAGTEVIHVDEEGAVLRPFAIALSGVVPNPGQLALVDSLLAAVSRPAEIVAIPRHDVLDFDDLESIPPPGAVECRVLRSSPDIVGLAQAPYRGDDHRVVECLAFVTLHGGRANVEAIADALYPRSGAALRRGRTENTLAALRACLGDGSTGQPLLARRGDEVSVSDEVSCDWQRAERAITVATRSEPRRAVELLRSALELVDGPPCASVLAGFAWLRAEAINQAIEGTLVDGAHRLCALALAADDAALARWAVETGRRCVPDSEILGRDLMAVSDAEGDRHGVRAAFTALEVALERLGHNEPSAETRALFDALESE